jgi:hypothetical protein
MAKTLFESLGDLFDNEKEKQLQELLTIRDRKIELQAQEIAILKKLLAGFQNGPRCDSGQDRYPVAEKDRADLETEGYPHYDELIRRP